MSDPNLPENFVQLVLDSTSEGIWTIGTDGLIKTANKSAMKMFGYSSLDQMVGKNSHDLVHYKKADGTHYPIEGCPIYDAFVKGIPCHLADEVLWRADGTSFYADYRSVPIRDGDKILGAVVTFVDNTLKRKFEEELILNRAWLTATLRGIGDAVIATDSSAEPLVTYMNPVCEKLTGWNATEAVGKPLLEVFKIINEQTRAPAANPVHKVLRDGKIAGLANHTVLIARDGQEHAIEDSAAPIIGLDQKIQGVVLVFRDVTLEKRARELTENHRQWLELAIRSIPTPIYMADPETGEYVFGNQAMEKMLGSDFPVGDEGKAQRRAMVAFDSDTGRRLNYEEFPSSRAARGEEVKGQRLIWKTATGAYHLSITATAIPAAYGNSPTIVFAVQDITDLVKARKVQENYLIEIERLAAEVMIDRAKLESIISDSPVGIALMRGPDFVFEKVNLGFTKLVGSRDYIDRPWRDVYSELKDPIQIEIMSEVFRTGETHRDEDVKFLIKDDAGKLSEQYYSYTYDRILSADEKPYGIILHCRRTTDEVLDKRRLAESEKQLSAAISVAKVGFYDWNMLTNQVTFSAQMESDWGIGAGGKFDSVVQYIHPNDRERVLTTINQSIQTGEHFRTEYRVVRPDGKTICVEAQGVVTFENAKPVRFFGTSVDITERKKTEEALAFERHQFEAIFQSSPAGMALWKGPTHIFDKLNPKFAEFFHGRDLIGKSIVDVAPELIGQGFIQLIDKVYATGEPYSGREVSAKIRGENGELEDRFFDFSYVQIRDPNGEPYGVFDHSVEVTDRVNARRDLEIAKLAAEQANQTKSSFLANMSHEIRTPLGAILGYTDMLKEKNLRPEDRQQFLETISRNGKALTRIIDDILDLAKVESGKLEVEKIEFSFLDLLDEVTDLFRERTQSKGITLRSHIPATTPARIISDPTRVRQILINIIGNAVKFTERGSVTIEVQDEPSEIKNKIGLKILVRDTGPGLTEDQLSRLFEPFVQADNSTTRKFGGTGLGLVLSKRLASALEGNVSVDSCAPGEGCTFVISFFAQLPTAPAATNGKAKASTDEKLVEAPVLNNVKILIADDSPDNLFLVKRMLTKLGAEIETADNGQVAFEMASKQRYDIILMDIQMPIMDGYEATRALRKNGCATPIVALTAHAMAEERTRSMNAGCDGHLTKPLDREQLTETIRAMVLQNPS